MTINHRALDFKMRVIEGSRMRAFQNNMFVFEITSSNTDSLLVELLLSEQYEITSINPIIIDGLRKGTRKGTFLLRPNTIGTLTLNFKIGDKVKTHTISSQTENPYVFGEPIKDEHLFFGRVKELSEIHRGVTKSNKQNFLLTGPRRVGKTSLLYQLKDRLHFPFISVLLTPEKMGYEHHQMFRSIILCLEDEIRENLGEEPPSLDWDIKTATSETPIDLFNYHFEQNLKKHLNWLTDKSREARVILLLDEANFLVTESPPDKIVHDSRQEFLRHILQTYDRIACVLAGIPRILRMTSATSPLYNIFSGIKLKGFSREETEMLIREPAQQVNILFENDAVEKIIEYSGCSPYYTQALCFLSIENMYESKSRIFDPNEAITISIPHVEAAIKRMLDMVDYGMKSLWDALEIDEREMLKRMTSENVVVDHLNKEVISRLIDLSLVVEVIRDQGTTSQKVYANIKAKFDEQWIKEQGM